MKRSHPKKSVEPIRSPLQKLDKRFSAWAIKDSAAENRTLVVHCSCRRTCSYRNVSGLPERDQNSPCESIASSSQIRHRRPPLSRSYPLYRVIRFLQREGATSNDGAAIVQRTSPRGLVQPSVIALGSAHYSKWNPRIHDKQKQLDRYYLALNSGFLSLFTIGGGPSVSG